QDYPATRSAAAHPKLAVLCPDTRTPRLPLPLPRQIRRRNAQSMDRSQNQWSAPLVQLGVESRQAFAQSAFRCRATNARAPRRRQGHRGVGSLSHAAELHLAPATYDPTALHPVSHDARPRRRPYSGQANRLHLGVSPTVNVFSDANTALLVVAKMTALGMLIC